MKKRITIIGTSGVPARYGGFETLAEELCDGLEEFFEITVFCSSKIYSKNERAKQWKSINRKFINLHANGFSSIFYDIRSILNAARKTDIMFILGGSATFILPVIRIIYPKLKIVFHPDGIEWKRTKWNFPVKLFLKCSIYTGCRHCHKIIIDNKALTSYYKDYLKKISLITYGGHYTHNNQTGDFWLTIARAEKENKLDLIAEAVISHPNQQWVLLSNWKNTKFGRKLQKKFHNFPNIEFKSANYNTEYTSNLLAECKGYIHGHSTGGTNPTLVSALKSNKRILCHNNRFNRETTFDKAEYFTDSSDLGRLISSDNFKKNEELFRKVESEYSWEKICQQYAKLFRSI